MSFKARLISFITGAATLVMAVFFFIAYTAMDIAEQRFGEESIRGKNVLWQKVMKVQLDSMENATSSLTRSRDALKALRKGQIAELTEAVKPTFNRLSSLGTLSKLQIADTSGFIIVSLPENFSGPTRKSLVKRAFQEKKNLKGIERDDDGQMVAEIAFPLFYRGKPAGTGIYMLKLQSAINNFKQADGSEIHILSNSGETEYSTDREQLEQIEIRQNPDNAKLQYKQTIGEHILNLVQLPMLDVSGQQIGQLLTTTDYTDSYELQSGVYLKGIVAGLAAFMLCMIFIYWFMNKAFNPMNKCLNIMHKISSGNLTDDIHIDCSGEFGQLMTGLKQMQTRLGSMIQDINAASDQIERSAGNLETVTQESSQRVNHQQQITQQLVDNIDQLVEASNAVTSSAEQSSGATHQASEEVSQGRDIITKGLQTIENISQQVNSAEEVVQEVHNGSENIGSVLDVIKGIAEQTNLLALNAAIEAARAGEQGRGFAVVADEVRTLASRTSESTNEIEAMIETLQKGASEAVAKMGGSIDMVNKGVEISRQADESFNAIAQTVTSIDEKSRLISASAEKQMALSQSMHNHVDSISAASNQAVAGNTTTVESSEELIKLAEQLKQKVSQFRT